MKQDAKSPTEPLEVTIYTRPGCHLCDEAKLQMAPLLAEFGARLREVNIDADPELRELYNLDVPVIFLADRKIAKHRLDPGQFRRQLVEARRFHTGRAHLPHVLRRDPQNPRVGSLVRRQLREAEVVHALQKGRIHVADPQLHDVFDRRAGLRCLAL